MPIDITTPSKDAAEDELNQNPATIKYIIEMIENIQDMVRLIAEKYLAV